MQKWHECLEGLVHPYKLIAVVDTAIVFCSVQMSVPGSRNFGYKKKPFYVSKVQSLMA